MGTHAFQFLEGHYEVKKHISHHCSKELQAFSLPVLLWDERWSTQSAEAAMIGQDMSRAKRAEKIDSHAAAVILQGAIDALAGSAI